ncbi:MAG: N-acetylmuramoyl-L-alanine amidase [Gaiellaceae bacterium MAG52_C11]|nr:N-acetylmuramoyl-L-alanine amidase [Candidatus Gaiellasilicea maunaloa]
MLAETLAAALICLDPGHGTASDVGRQLEPIGPRSRELKVKDGGGTVGEAPVALAIAQHTRAALLARGLRVATTRERDGYRGGNRERARFCNAHGASLMLRIHADGSTDPSRHGIATLVPARRRGWTDDVYGPSARAGRLVQRELVRATGARDLGVVERSDLTGFNWADVPVVLAETGFLSNPAEGARLRSVAYQRRIATALANAAANFVARGRS